MSSEADPPEPPAVPGVCVREGDEGRGSEWALVLAAAGIEHRLDGEAGAFRLRVAIEDEARARAALDGYDAERAEAPAAAAPDYGPTQLGLVAAALLCLFHLWVVRTPLHAWAARGDADAARLVGGEPWRALTALTLHADLAHLAGNAASLWLLGNAVARRLGPGLAAWLLVAVGFAGNLAVAIFYRSFALEFRSLGASTAAFGALGLLAGLQAVSKRGVRRWVAFGAALALLGMLGVGAHADVLAHLFGLCAGAIAGAASGTLRRRAPARSILEPLAALAAGATLVAAWALALHAPLRG